MAVVVDASQKKNVIDIFVGKVWGGGEPITTDANGFGNTVSLLQVIARKEKKEGRGRKEGDRQDGNILNQKKRASRFQSGKRMKPGKCGFKLNQWK